MNDQYDHDKSQKNDPEQKDKSAKDNLIHLSEKNTAASSADFNSRLKNIETELLHLNARESATNKAFRELLSESRKIFSEQNGDLKETREQISGVMARYQKLTQDYQRIAASSNILSLTLEQARSEMSAEISSLKLSTTERDDELADGQLQMIERANRIEQQAVQTAQDLDSRVNVIRTTISAVENKLAEQIQEVAAQSEQRDEALTIRANMLEENIAQQTNQLKQADTELMSKLAGQNELLKQTDSELRAFITEETELLKKSGNELNSKLTKEAARLDQTDNELFELSAGIVLKTGNLTRQTEDQQFQLNILDSRSTDLEERSDELEEASDRHSARLAQVDETIERQHKGFAIALVLIVITLAILSMAQQSRWLETGQRDLLLKDSISAQQKAMTAQETAIALQTENLQELDRKNQKTHAALSSTDEKIIASVDKQQQLISRLKQDLGKLQDETVNNASRLNAMSPYKTFGQDNTIHSPEWLVQQDPEKYVVQVMTVASKQDLYTLAYRWSSLFNESNLSYMETEQDGKILYTLLYGTFDDSKRAVQISRHLPVFSYDSRPVVRKLDELL